jgi:hypothetical protein
MFSIVAKLILSCKDFDVKFWKNNMAYLSLGCFEILHEHKPEHGWAHELLQDPVALKNTFTPLLVRVFQPLHT